MGHASSTRETDDGFEKWPDYLYLVKIFLYWNFFVK